MPDQLHSLQTAFADDLAVVAPLLRYPTEPSPLIGAIARMPSAVVTILCTRGMVTNDKPAKSGLLVSLVGRGSVITRRCLAKVDTIPVVGFNIQLVDSYQHAG